ncbi:hypothetical protein ACFL35_17055 [Candidatus Riflebacteria bacterium]
MEYRNVNKEEYPQLKSFFESFYGSNYCEMEVHFYNWLHHENPIRPGFASENEYTSFAAFDKKEIITCINYVPIDFYVKGQKYPACWSVGWLTRDGYPGVAGFLLKKHFKKFHFYMSMGATQWVKTIYTTQFGFEYQHNIGRSIMVGGLPEKLLQLLKRNQELQLSDFQRIYEWAEKTKEIASKSDFVFIRNFSDLRGKYWSDHLKRCRATVAKDQTYMKWRYFEHPHIDYDIISGTSEQDEGIAILRKEEVRDSSEMIIRMVEFLPTMGNEKKLAGIVARYLMENRGLFLDFFCGSRPFLKEYLKCPFIQPEEHHPFLFPRMFQPLEWRERYSINASFCENRKKHQPPFDIHLEEVYFTKGDPSQDIVLNREYVTRGL